MNRINILETFDLSEGVYFQRDLERKLPFENKYLAIREKEKRIYTDEQVRQLPNIEKTHQHYREWCVRNNSVKHLVRYVNQKQFKTILEIGCGNGWLSSHLASTKAEVFALDVNEAELKQGSRVFKKIDNLNFIYADVLTNPFNKEMIFDLIVLASSVQYFPDVANLINCLKTLLTNKGEIHLLDSPIYQSKPEASAAKKRSEEYFNGLEQAWMNHYYFHHSFYQFRDFNYTIAHNPASIYNRLMNLFTESSPFPWIIIPKSNQ